MLLAIPHDEDFVAKHFGKTKEFKVYLIEDGKIRASQIIPTNGFGHEVIGVFLKDLKIDAVICQKMGRLSKEAMDKAGITIYPGVMGVADVRAEQFAAGTLNYNADVLCECTDEHEGGEGDCCSEGDCASCSANCGH
jgi:predicted Fe-Mo cluster-binding NifX family protein